MKMENKLKNLQIYAVMVCLLMAISPLAMAEEIASNAKSNLNTSIDESDEVEWQVVWQDDTGSASTENGEPQIIPFIIMAAYVIYTAYTTIDDIKQGDYVSAIVGLFPQGKAIKIGEKGLAIIKSMEKTTSRLKVGLKTETAVISALGKTKNTKTVSAPVDGTKVNTIPDYIDDTAKEVGEIKDYADGNVLSNIKQIRAQMAWAKDPKAVGKSKAVAYNYKLYLNDCSQRSKKLIEAMDAEGFKCYEISSLLTK